MKNKVLFFVFILLFIYALLFASRLLLSGNIVFHTDIARDMLLIEDIVKNKPITLLGPRAGGIPGVFHGPLWLYLNLPAFLIGGGNPTIIGWFWLLLYVINIYIIYLIGKKIFNREVGTVAALITAVVTAHSASSLFNPFGAVVLSPIFLYLLYRYIEKYEFKYLISSLFVLGLIIQFQMAFGLPILFLTLPILVCIFIINKKFLHFLGLLILIIPLSTFILFDIKHQFLQTKSVINYMTGIENLGKVEISLPQLLSNRFRLMLTDGFYILKNNLWLSYAFVALIGMSLYKIIRLKGRKKYLRYYLLSLYFYIGYFVITLLFKGTIWDYYYWPFLNLSALLFAASLKFTNRKLFFILFFILVFLYIRDWGFNFKIKKNLTDGLWQYYYQSAKDIYQDAPQEFGYYIFNDDQFGYSSRYAMNYSQGFNKKQAYPYTKKKNTYLLIFPSHNDSVNDLWWKENKVKINKKPIKVFKYINSDFRIEKYELTNEEINNLSDDTLIHTLIFR